MNAQRPTGSPPPAPSLVHLRRLTDGRGLWQHARHGVPDRRHGYCLDDNARALWLCARLARGEGADGELGDLATVYASFVDHVWDAGTGRFCNFVAHDGTFLGDEAAGGEDEDATARALLALAASASALPDAVAGWARDRTGEVLGHVARHRSPRAWCWSLHACRAILDCEALAPLHDRATTLGLDLSARMLERWHAASRPHWPWFEESLAYDNARLAQGALDGARFEPRLAAIGLRALEWLCGVQTGPAGLHRPIGTDGFGRPHTASTPFEPYAQQPIDAWATVEACVAALRLTGDEAWRARASAAHAWFEGANDVGAPLADPATGACRDGIDPQGVSVNRGAESTLAWLHAATVMGSFTDRTAVSA